MNVLEPSGLSSDQEKGAWTRTVVRLQVQQPAPEPSGFKAAETGGGGETVSSGPSTAIPWKAPGVCLQLGRRLGSSLGKARPAQKCPHRLYGSPKGMRSQGVRPPLAWPKSWGPQECIWGGAPAELGTPGRTREELSRSLCSDGRPSALSCLGSLKVTCPVSRDAVWLPALECHPVCCRTDEPGAPGGPQPGRQWPLASPGSGSGSCRPQGLAPACRALGYRLCVLKPKKGTALWSVGCGGPESRAGDGGWSVRAGAGCGSRGVWLPQRLWVSGRAGARWGRGTQLRSSPRELAGLRGSLGVLSELVSTELLRLLPPLDEVQEARRGHSGARMLRRSLAASSSSS